MDMLSKLLGWIALAAGLAAGSVGLAAPATAQDTNDEFYEFYEGGFDPQADRNDWFYDYYEYSLDEREDTDLFADYDWDEDEFEWEEDDLFA